jgi:hypothetical protein
MQPVLSIKSKLRLTEPRTLSPKRRDLTFAHPTNDCGKGC